MRSDSRCSFGTAPARCARRSVLGRERASGPAFARARCSLRRRRCIPTRRRRPVARNSAVRAVPMVIAYSDQASRGDGPQTARGQRTRSALLAAARRTFEERGYVDTRVVDITRLAKVSYGSFYTYFPSKEAVFAEVVVGLIQDFRATVRAEPVPGSTPGDLIARTNRGYLRAYRQNAAMMAIL